MPKQTILGLEKTLCDLGYNPEHIKTFVGTIDQILQRGFAETKDRRIISSAGIRPLFKINPKSADVYLNTTSELNILRIHHPSNTWVFKNPTDPACFCGNQKWLATRAFGLDGEKRGPNKGFTF